MAAYSARFIACLSCCDFKYVCVVVRVMGLTINTPNAGMPVLFYQSVHMKSLGPHAAWKCLMGGRLWMGICMVVSG